MSRAGRRRFMLSCMAKIARMIRNGKPIVVVGSINIDLVARAERVPVAGETVHSSDFQMHPGGKGANQAVAVARLGYPVRMIWNVGSDAFGEELRTQLVRSGVDASSVRTSKGPSGVAMIAVGPNGDNAIVVTPGANALVSPKDVDDHAEAIREAGVVLTQLEIPLETVQYLGTLCVRLEIPLILDPAQARVLPADLASSRQLAYTERNGNWLLHLRNETSFESAGNLRNSRCFGEAMPQWRGAEDGFAGLVSRHKRRLPPTRRGFPCIRRRHHSSRGCFQRCVCRWTDAGKISPRECTVGSCGRCSVCHAGWCSAVDADDGGSEPHAYSQRSRKLGAPETKPMPRRIGRHGKVIKRS